MIHKNTSKLILEELGEDCKKCGHCCSYGSGILLKEEVAKIACYLKLSIEDFREKYLEEFEAFGTKHSRFKQNKTNDKHPYGSCVFLENKECKIHNLKPLYCRIGNCRAYGDDAIQWFHLNYSVDKFNPNSIREWKIYSENKKVIPGGDVTDLVADEEILKKMLSYEILK